jgi:hypothetical protein
MPNSAEILKQKFTHSLGLPFQEILPESVIASVLEQENVSYRDRFFKSVRDLVGISVAGTR